MYVVFGTPQVATTSSPIIMKLKIFLLSSALLLASGPVLHASVDSVLTLDLKCFYQDSSIVKGDTQYGKAGTLRVDSKQLIILISRESNTKFPSGSQLTVMTDGKVFVTPPKGGAPTDVTRYISATIASDKGVYHGSYNFKTGQQNLRNYYPITLKIKLPTLKATIKGTATEDLNTRKPDTDGVQISTSATKSAVSGDGWSKDMKAYFEGTLLMKGRQAEVTTAN